MCFDRALRLRDIDRCEGDRVVSAPADRAPGRTPAGARCIEPLTCRDLVLIDVDRGEGDQPPPPQENGARAAASTVMGAESVAA